ncbi:MAG: DivIVA domain-containing protein [Melioribacteraceae bacterium]|nr:DivIVA domain-containing protein [Melioribacteraceae bacterium]
MLLSFGVGWFMNPGFKWNAGVKVIYIVTLVSVIVSLIIVALFRNSFDLNSSVIDILVHYSLRVFVLGMVSIFGLSVAEILKHKKVTIESEDNENYVFSPNTSESELVINEAKLKAEKIIFEAEKEAHNINDRKTRIEIQLRELIQTEREVIRNYEKEDGTSKDKNVE